LNFVHKQMPNENEITALVDLLEDPDELIFDQIKHKLIEIGPNVIPHLENAWEKKNFGLLFQNRVESLIHDIQYKDLLQTISKWTRSPIELIDGVLLINKYQYPTLKRKEIEDLFQLIANDVRSQISEHMTGIEKVMAINHILFEVYQFKGDNKNYHHPKNSYLNEVLKSKKGNPLLLSIIYLEIAKRINLPIKGINLPNHFVIGFLDEEYKKPIMPDDSDSYGILFYINPFSKGVILHQDEIADFLRDLNLAQKPKYFKPCNNVAIVKRILTNLIYNYSKMNKPDKVDELKKIISLF